MALKSTVYKATLQISNMNTHYYQQHQLTLAKHPSETEERLMVRLVAYILYLQEGLSFGKGVSEEQEPALWLKDLTGAVDLWLEVGLPDERRIRKACGLAKQVVVITYGKRSPEMWWEQNREVLTKRNNLTIMQLPAETTQELAKMADRNMVFNCIIEGSQLSILSETATVNIDPLTIYQGA